MLRLNTELIVRLMVSQRITRTDLAERSGLHRNTIYAMLMDRNDPGLETVSRLAAALNVNPFVLLTDEPVKSEPPSEPPVQ